MSETENKVSQERQPIHPARKIVFGSLISLSILPIAMLLIAVLWSVKPMIKQSSAQDDAAQEIAAANGHAKGALINFTTCATCHGMNGEGNPKMHAPRIADLAPWYVKAQLEKFKSGLIQALCADYVSKNAFTHTYSNLFYLDSFYTIVKIREIRF